MTAPPPFLRRAPASTALLALLLVVAGCGCPRKVERFGSPAETLATWQAQLCHDDPRGEYRCLSASLQRQMRGFETYYAARRRLFDEEPLLAWALRHRDLPGRAVETVLTPDGRAASMLFVERGRRITLGFVLETRAFFELPTGEVHSALQELPLADSLRAQGRQYWLRLSVPRGLSEDDQQRLVGLRVEPQWKIDAIEGLLEQVPAPPTTTSFDTAP